MISVYLLLDLAKKWGFYLRDRNFYITEKFFSWSLRIFSP